MREREAEIQAALDRHPVLSLMQSLYESFLRAALPDAWKASIPDQNEIRSMERAVRKAALPHIDRLCEIVLPQSHRNAYLQKTAGIGHSKNRFNAVVALYDETRFLQDRLKTVMDICEGRDDGPPDYAAAALENLADDMEEYSIDLARGVFTQESLKAHRFVGDLREHASNYGDFAGDLDFGADWNKRGQAWQDFSDVEAALKEIRDVLAEKRDMLEERIAMLQEARDLIRLAVVEESTPALGDLVANEMMSVLRLRLPPCPHIDLAGLKADRYEPSLGNSLG